MFPGNSTGNVSSGQMTHILRNVENLSSKLDTIQASAPLLDSSLGEMRRDLMAHNRTVITLIESDLCRKPCPSLQCPAVTCEDCSHLERLMSRGLSNLSSLRSDLIPIRDEISYLFRRAGSMGNSESCPSVCPPVEPKIHLECPSLVPGQSYPAAKTGETVPPPANNTNTSCQLLHIVSRSYKLCVVDTGEEGGDDDNDFTLDQLAQALTGPLSYFGILSRVVASPGKKLFKYNFQFKLNNLGNVSVSYILGGYVAGLAFLPAALLLVGLAVWILHKIMLR